MSTIRELQEECNIHNESANNYHAKFNDSEIRGNKLQADNDRLKEREKKQVKALEFYRSGLNHCRNEPVKFKNIKEPIMYSKVMIDGGVIALDALQEKADELLD